MIFLEKKTEMKDDFNITTVPLKGLSYEIDFENVDEFW